MNKKILLLFTAIIFMMSTSNVSASEGCGVYTEEDLAFYESLNRPDIYDLSCSNGTPFTNEYLETLNQDPNVMTRRYFANKIDVPAFEQLPNYCGPASMKQAIHAIRGQSKTQQYYGTLVGTNTQAGTDQRYIAGAMNSELGISKYTYEWTNNIKSDSEFYNIVNKSISMGYPLIMHIRMERMPAYNYSNNGGHFVTISGHTITGIINNDYSPINIYYVDPNKAYNYGSAFGEKMVSLPIIKSAGYAGVLVYAV
jgi:hypothetical protein